MTIRLRSHAAATELAKGGDRSRSCAALGTPVTASHCGYARGCHVHQVVPSVTVPHRVRPWRRLALTRASSENEYPCVRPARHGRGAMKLAIAPLSFRGRETRFGHRRRMVVRDRTDGDVPPPRKHAVSARSPAAIIGHTHDKAQLMIFAFPQQLCSELEIRLWLAPVLRRPDEQAASAPDERVRRARSVSRVCRDGPRRRYMTYHR